MSETRWTRGDWIAEVGDKGGYEIRAGDGVICSRVDWPYRAAESSANATLIAAAPALAEVLEWIADIADKNYEQDDKLRSNGARVLIRISDRARAALAAARGETP